METILTVTISILLVLALATLVNNAYNATDHHLFTNPLFGTQSIKIIALKYGSIALFLSISFLFGSMAIGFLLDANFLVNANYDAFSSSSSSEHLRAIFEKGFALALVSNRMLCMSFPLLLWMLGPLPVWLASLALVWGLYQLDFSGKLTKCCDNK